MDENKLQCLSRMEMPNDYVLSVKESTLSRYLKERHPVIHYIDSDKRIESEDVAPHMHADLFQVSWYSQGEGEFTIMGRTFKIENNVFFVINPGELHQIRPEGKSSLECITCRFSMPGFSGKLLSTALKLDSKLIPEGEMLLKKTLAEAVLSTDKSMIKASFLFSELLMLLDEQRQNGLNDSLSDPVRKALVFMNENFRKEISIDDVASNSRVTTSHFCRTFKKEMGGSPLSYLRKLKLGYAAERLFTSREKISIIAVNSGFKNTKNLNMAFKQSYGMSTQQFRKKYFENYRGR